MNFAELQEQFVANTNCSASDFSSSELAGWLNEAQIDLAYDLGNIEEKTYPNATAGTFISLPKKAVALFDDGSDSYYMSLTGKIMPRETGPLTIYYRKLPCVYVEVEGEMVLTNHGFTGMDDTETSELHEALHNLLLAFACSRYWDSESEGDTEENNLGTKWMQMYSLSKRQAIDKLSVATGNTEADRWTIID